MTIIANDTIDMKTSSPLNICLLCHEWPPLNGGIGTYTYNLAKGLLACGHCVHILTHHQNPTLMNGIRIHPIAPSLKKRLWVPQKQKATRLHFDQWTNAVTKYFSELISRTQIDIIETPEYGAWGRHLSQFHIPMIVRCHSPIQIILSMASAEFGPASMPRWAHNEEEKEKQQALQATALVSPSYALANYLSLHWNIPRTKFEIIPNPIDTNLFHVNKQKPANDQREILYVGRLDAYKGIYDFIEATTPILSQYPETALKIIGTDKKSPHGYTRYGKTASEVIRNIIPETLNNRVCLTPHISAIDLVSHYQNAYCSVMPTKGFESFSYIVAESMACGTPIIATQCGGPAEIIEHGSNGFLVEPGKPQEIKQAVEYLLNHSDKRDTIGNNARQRIKKHYSIDTLTSSIINHYRQVIKNFHR